MQKKGLLIVLSGFSGVGKGTIVRELLRRYPDEFSLSISATSRKIREGEQEGREYFYVSREEFEQMIAEDRLLEHAVYNGNYYGTPKDYVLREIGAGRNVILEIEVQGGLQIRDKFPDSLLLYVVPPSAKELYDRLIGREFDVEAGVLTPSTLTYEIVSQKQNTLTLRHTKTRTTYRLKRVEEEAI